MSEPECFLAPDGTVRQLCLPFLTDSMICNWSALLPSMARCRPEAFTRVEWAYLMTFLDGDNLRRPFHVEFGTPVRGHRPPDRFVRPRGQVALWLPNNVSLLGPLVAILISLSGNSMKVKLGSRGADLIGEFFSFCRSRSPEGPLLDWLSNRVEVSRFDRQDARNAEMARAADVRIVFGSDQAARAIEALPHSPDSLGIYFTDRVSEAWVQPRALTDEVVSTLARVFAVYGRRGCTSPARVVILGGEQGDALGLRDRLVNSWTGVTRVRPAQSLASECIMACQLARARGWQAVLAPGHGAVFASGGRDLDAVEGTMVLPITWASPEEAVSGLPANIQTVGYALEHPEDQYWQGCVRRAGVKRFVPLATMHHFSHVWDGIPFWRALFEEVR